MGATLQRADLNETQAKPRPFVSSWERSLLGFVEWFANADPSALKSTKEVEGRAMRAVGLTRATFKEIWPHEVEAYPDEQQRVRERLERVIAPTLPVSLLKELNRYLSEKVDLQLVRERKHLELRAYPNGVEAVLAVGYALLLEDRRGLRGRLRQCRAPNCGKFFFNIDIGGRPQEFCSTKHRMAFHNSQRKLRS